MSILNATISLRKSSNMEPTTSRITSPDTAPAYSTISDCLLYEKFSNFGWENLYKKNMIKVIDALDLCNDVSRLYLLIQLDTSFYHVDETISKLQIYKINQSTEAVQLTNNLKDIMPDADPVYLDLVGEVYASNHEGLTLLLEVITTKRKSYPKEQEYNERVKDLQVINSLTKMFNVNEFLKMCPNPENYFNDIKPNRGTNQHHEESISYLYDRFKRLSVVKLRSMFLNNGCNLTKTVEAIEVDKCKKTLKKERKASYYGYNCGINFKNTTNIEFLKEMAYLTHKEEILNHKKCEETIHRMKVEEAKSVGQLRTCECCYNDELLGSEVNCCPAGHYFCGECIKKGTEVAVGLSKLEFKCFADCNEEFNILLIKEFIDDKLYERIMRLKQAQEIKAAGIEGLETCAFCDYSVILSPDIKTIKCLNSDCKKETCRECREESHFPLRCDQIEKAPEVKVRTMIENKMTEVLIRTCYYCNCNFVKEDGCNKMTCSCGKHMCYICRRPVTDNYSHFYHTQIIEDKCPLYTDENLVHSTAVEAAARLIVNDLKIKQPELLKNINLEKILPDIVNRKRMNPVKYSSLDTNKVIATLLGQNVEDINNIKDMRPTTKKMKRSQ